MAELPTKNRELIQGLKSTLENLYDQEEEAARTKNDTLQRAAHAEILKIREFIKSVVDNRLSEQIQ